MAFSAKQVRALRRNLNSRYIRTREANGRELSYIEGWYAISEANRIFGFDGWDRPVYSRRFRSSRKSSEFSLHNANKDGGVLVSDNTDCEIAKIVCPSNRTARAAYFSLQVGPTHIPAAFLRLLHSLQ
jgi:Rad52/22 family double-strand break repair protein